MRILFALAGLHRYNRGAEIAFISIANELSRTGDSVTLIGSGGPRLDTPYQFIHAGSLRRENFEDFPTLPLLRTEYVYEELTFLPTLLRRYHPLDFDVTVTCSYPFTNWALRRPAVGVSRRPPHVYVTQNGDWPAQRERAEYRFFGCEGLVCTNPDFYERNERVWPCRLIPNGVDWDRFRLASPKRQDFKLPADQFVVLMVSALIDTKRVDLGIEAVSRIENAHLVVAGDGPLRSRLDHLGEKLLPGRFSRVSIAPEQMPALYHSADVFMHLSKEEAFGNVFLEAMACGLPVVTGQSAHTKWILGDDEYLFDGDDPAAIAKQIELARQSSQAKRESRVRKAAAFSWKKIAPMYREFFKEVIASHDPLRQLAASN